MSEPEEPATYTAMYETGFESNNFDNFGQLSESNIPRMAGNGESAMEPPAATKLVSETPVDESVVYNATEHPEGLESSSFHEKAADADSVEKSTVRSQEEREERRRLRRERRERRRKEKQKKRDELAGADGPKRKRRGRYARNTEDGGGAGGQETDEDLKTDIPATTIVVFNRQYDSNSMVSQRARRTKKRKKVVVTEDEAANYVRAFLDRMNAVAEEDEAIFAAGRPAVRKLEVVDEFAAEVAKPKWVHWFMREGLSNTLAKWLAVLPNGSLPNVTIRSRLLNLMLKIPFQIDAMQGSELGHRLIAMWKSPQETEENRNAIRELVFRLMRPLFGVSRPAATMYLPSNDGSSSTKAREAEAPNEPLLSTTTRRARIPRLTGYSFKVMPQSNITTVTADSVRDNHGAASRLSKFLSSGGSKRAAGRSAARASTASYNV